MIVTINSEKREIEEELTLTKLLIHLGLSDKPVVIELNRTAIAPSEFEAKKLADGDNIEIITIAAGG